MPPPIKPQTTKPASPETRSPEHPFEGDYRPTAPVLFHPHASDPKIRVEPLQVDFLHKLADALNTTLDLNTLMHRVADLVRAVIDYKIFAILLLNDRSEDLRMRFQIGQQSLHRCGIAGIEHGTSALHALRSQQGRKGRRTFRSGGSSHHARAGASQSQRNRPPDAA